MKSDISYTKKLLRSSRIKIIGSLVLFLVAGFVAMSVGILDLIKNDKWRNPVIWLGFSAFILGILYAKLLESFSRWFNKSQDKLHEDNRRSYEGVVGEDTLFAWAGKLFDSRYHQLPNFKISGEKFDIDLVVVGPRGIFMFEVKKPSSSIDFKDNKAFFAGTNHLLPHNPLSEVERHRDIFSRYLDTIGYGNEKVHSALIIVGKITVEGKPGIWIANNEESLKKYIDDFQDDTERYSPDFCDKLFKLLNSNK